MNGEKIPKLSKCGYDSYVEDAREKLRQYYCGNRTIERPEFLRYLELRAARLCPNCGADSGISSYETKSEKNCEHIAVRFVCGHGDLQVICKETIRISDALRLGISGAEETELGVAQKIGARIIDFKETKEGSEQAVVRRLCVSKKQYLTEISGYEQNSAIDVIARGLNKEEKFQVTKLYGKDFWKPLNTEGAIDLLVINIEELVTEAIKRKMQYSPEQRIGLSLVIDAWPGIAEVFVKDLKTKLADLIKKSLYFEVWLVGEHTGAVHRL